MTGLSRWFINFSIFAKMKPTIYQINLSKSPDQILSDGSKMWQTKRGSKDRCTLKRRPVIIIPKYIISSKGQSALVIRRHPTDPSSFPPNFNLTFTEIY